MSSKANMKSPTKPHGLAVLEKRLCIPPRVLVDMQSMNPALSKYNSVVCENLDVLETLYHEEYEKAKLRSLLCHCPHLLTANMEPWVVFLQSYGLSETSIKQLLKFKPDLFVKGNIYTAGINILKIKSTGHDDDYIKNIIIPSFPSKLLELQ